MDFSRASSSQSTHHNSPSNCSNLSENDADSSLNLNLARPKFLDTFTIKVEQDVSESCDMQIRNDDTNLQDIKLQPQFCITDENDLMEENHIAPGSNVTIKTEVEDTIDELASNLHHAPFDIENLQGEDPLQNELTSEFIVKPENEWNVVLETTREMKNIVHASDLMPRLCTTSSSDAHSDLQNALKVLEEDISDPEREKSTKPECEVDTGPLKCAPSQSTSNLHVPTVHSKDSEMCVSEENNPLNIKECIIQQLLKTPFGSRSNTHQLQIIKNDRPTPNLCNLNSKNKARVRKFHTFYYDKISWLTGCEIMNKVFCWPCMLFSTTSSVWNKGGYCDMNNFDTSVKRHSNTQNHKRAVLALLDYKETNVYIELNVQPRINLQQHNAKVDKNRSILKRLIDTVLYLAIQEIGFQGNDEHNTSIDYDNCIEIINMLSKNDKQLCDHLETSLLFKGTSNHIQNDILQSIATVLKKYIHQECLESDFVSLIINDASCISNNSQVSKVMRLCKKSGEVKERFRGFEDVSKDRTAVAVYRIFKNEILEIDSKNRNKVVGLAYDGASIMLGCKSDLQTLVKEEFPLASIISAHMLNSVLMQIGKQIPQCRLFFINMEGIAYFFSQSTKIEYLMEKIINKRLPRTDPTRLCFKSRLLNTIQETREDLITLCCRICEEEDCDEEDKVTWCGDDIILATGCLSHLEDFHFNFLLITFSAIFDKTDKLYNVLQTKEFEINACIKTLTKTIEYIEEFKLKFQDVYSATEVTTGGPPTKRKSNSPQTYKDLYEKIHDVIIKEIKERYDFLNALEFIELVDSTRFTEFDENGYPHNLATKLEHSYGDLFDMANLKNELEVVYKSIYFCNKTVAEIFKSISSNEILGSEFLQVRKLCALILTLPSNTVSEENNFSVLKKIKTYLRNEKELERLSALAIILIENELLSEIRKNTNFYDLVIEEFSQKDGCAELHYKH